MVLVPRGVPDAYKTALHVICMYSEHGLETGYTKRVNVILQKEKLNLYLALRTLCLLPPSVSCGPMFVVRIAALNVVAWHIKQLQSWVIFISTYVFVIPRREKSMENH